MSGKVINIVDLFCGCGGLSYGFELAGYKVLLGIDSDEAALKTFEYNHKDSASICGDITQVNRFDIINKIGNMSVDLIVGGPPCQGMSLSGHRQFQDPRNALYLSFIRLVKELRPQGFVIENVPGLVGLFKGAIKDNILQEFKMMGYNVVFKIVNAAEYGVPQLRKRVIFVGLRKGEFEFPDAFCDDSKYINCEMAIGDLPTLDGDFLGSDEQLYNVDAVSVYQTNMRKDSSSIRNHIASCHSESVKYIISMVPEGGNYKNLPEEYRDTRKFNVAWTRFHSKKPAPTIDTGHRHHFHYKYNRVPTVRESARLQSFPDKFIFFGNKTQQFRQVGNAVPPLLARAIAEQLKKYL